jgi:hypothetical protein
MMRVITFIEDLIQTVVNLPDIWRESDAQISIGINAAN